METEQTKRTTPTPELFQWIRNKKGEKRGALIAIPISTGVNGQRQIGLGWSLCCKNDKFDPARARNIAELRALTGSKVPVPASVVNVYTGMANRAKKYFKGMGFAPAFVRRK